MTIVLRTENLGKRYWLRHSTDTWFHYRAFRDVVAEQARQVWQRICHPGGQAGGAGRDAFWAMRHVAFEVNAGECVGIIGRNGAGKSTLLKLISRITRPTEGRISYNGRIASLLEVGTGFHGELTGRENIFLSGAILGMTRAEIYQKFDAIVDFAEVSRFLETPVKFYSSGMYVRLAFAVAAHLEPDILLVDEVLAVGDAQFQQKCLGKMEAVTREQGRTILFVSHNMSAIKTLCSRALLLDQGGVVDDGRASDVIHRYLHTAQSDRIHQQSWADPATAPGAEFIRLHRVALVTPPEADTLDIRMPLGIEIAFWNTRPDAQLDVCVDVLDSEHQVVFSVFSYSLTAHAGLVTGTMQIPGHFLNDGDYTVTVYFNWGFSTILFELHDVLRFHLVDYRDPALTYYDPWTGAVRPDFLRFPLENV